MKVTFLVPAYNAMRTIKYTVESMQSQTLKEFLAIIIDDGSTDGTGDYLESINDNRFRVIHQANSGYVSALMRGSEMIETPYFARLDADDIALPDRLEKQVEFLERNPDVAVVGSRVGYVAGKKGHFKIGVGRFKLEPTFAPAMKNAPFWSPHSDGNSVAHPSVTIRTDAFRKIGGYRDLAPSEDLDLWLRVEDAGYKLACLDDMLVLYRVTGSSESSKAHYKQLLRGRYARHCHECRRAGLQEPTLEQFEISHPLSDDRISDAVARLKIRNALGDLLGGQVFRGGIRMIAAVVCHPGAFANKLRTRMRIASK